MRALANLEDTESLHDPRHPIDVLWFGIFLPQKFDHLGAGQFTRRERLIGVVP